MDEKLKNMRNTPVYPYSAAYARFAGELELFRKSKQANQECGRAIDAAIDAAWDGMRLPPEAGAALMERFGPERLGYVLADTIQQRSGDARFSAKNREWARSFPMLVSTESRWELGPNSHSAKLDGLITQLRPELEQAPELAARAETLKNIPLYLNSMQYAQGHGEGTRYAASREANILCKEAIEAAIASNHDGLSSKTVERKTSWNGSAMTEHSLCWPPPSGKRIGISASAGTISNGQKLNRPLRTGMRQDRI